jgi:hypothetical protein
MRSSLAHVGRWIASASCLVLVVSACTKDKPAAPSGDKPANNGTVAAGGTDKPAAPAVPEGRAALAQAWPVLRCALIGAAPQDDKLWQTHGFASAEAFATAWQTAAAADPVWARGVVSAAYASPCAVGPAGAPTPTDAPAAVTPAAPVPAPKAPAAAPAKAP